MCHRQMTLEEVGFTTEEDDRAKERHEMKVRMKGELIEKGMVSNALGSITKAAKKIRCDPRTLKSAIDGHPVRLSTATNICKVLYLELLEGIIPISKPEALLPDGTKQEKTEFAKATIGASLAARAAINASLGHHGENSPEEVGYVLSMLLYDYTAHLPEEDRFYFINTICSGAKKAIIHGGLVSEEPEETTESN